MLKVIQFIFILAFGIPVLHALPVIKERIVLDVRIIDGLIVTEASVDGTMGNFIVDSGAPGLVLNTSDPKEARAHCASINELFSCSEKRVEEFRWNHIRRSGINALLVDLSEIESAIGFKITGLIGFQLFKKEKLFINFSRQEIVFLPKKVSNAEATFKEFANFVTPFTIEGTIPVIEYWLNGKKIRLGIDSGAKSNVLDKTVVSSQTPDMILAREPIELAGVNATIILSELITLYNEDALNPFITTNKFVSADLSHIRESGYEIDGLVGPAFFKNCLLLFDFQDMKIYAGFAE